MRTLGFVSMKEALDKVDAIEAENKRLREALATVSKCRMACLHCITVAITKLKEEA